MTSAKKNNQPKKKTTHQKSAASHRGVIIIIVVLVLLAAGVITAVFLFTGSYHGRIFPGTHMGDLDLGGMTYEQARAAIVEKSQQVTDTGFAVIYNDEEHAISSIVGDEANPELATPLITYDIDTAITDLKTAVDSQSELEQLYNWATGWEIVPAFSVDSEALFQELETELGAFETPAVDAALLVAEDGGLSVSAERSGQAFDYEEIINVMIQQLGKLQSPTVVAILYDDQPVITKARAEQALPLAKQALVGAPYYVSYNDYRWIISEENVREWLDFSVVDGAVTVELGVKSLGAYIEEMASIIDVKVQEARFQMTNGRVTEFQPSQTGLAVQIDAAYDAINQAVRQQATEDVQLVVEEVAPEQTTGSMNEMGIKELIGEGRSDFSGSPANRRHNIAVGAAAINGILIAPGEEFSLIKALGEIDGEHGYKQELVIKGNQTIPEYGGGLCQIGTTTFRAVLDTGLNITERRNHSYRVSYYEPAGTDATIYDPAPDFKFINDMEHHVLLTTAIEGNEVIFRFYGTDDGRQAEMTTPRIYNYVKPGPTKLVETTTLAPGVKKCTESAHTGADAEFTHTITYASGEQKVDVYRSHYKPWQEVCLIGVEELTPEQDTAETT